MRRRESRDVGHKNKIIPGIRDGIIPPRRDFLAILSFIYLVGIYRVCLHELKGLTNKLGNLVKCGLK